MGKCYTVFKGNIQCFQTPKLMQLMQPKTYEVNNLSYISQASLPFLS